MYTVTTKNVKLMGAFAGIVVEVDDAHINLAQAVIDGSSGNTNYGICIHLVDRTGVHINGGTLQKCTVGVLLGDPLANTGGGSNNHINGIEIRNSRISASTSFNGDGIVINDGVNNRVNNNQVSNVGNGGLSAGIRLWGGSDNDVVGNTVQSMLGYSAGLLLQGADNTDVHGNTVSNNPSLGIWVQADALGNFISGNTALNNGNDILDYNADCGDNTWHGNTFGTANQTCIQ
jgi:parallel beta-helix repeat protein